MRWLAESQAEKITTPMLVVGAGNDRICLTPEAKALASRTPYAQYVEIAEAGHEILMEKNVYRAQFWEAFDAFVQERLVKNDVSGEHTRSERKDLGSPGHGFLALAPAGMAVVFSWHEKENRAQLRRGFLTLLLDTAPPDRA